MSHFKPVPLSSQPLYGSVPRVTLLRWGSSISLSVVLLACGGVADLQLGQDSDALEGDVVEAPRDAATGEVMTPGAPSPTTPVTAGTAPAGNPVPGLGYLVDPATGQLYLPCEAPAPAVAVDAPNAPPAPASDAPQPVPPIEPEVPAGTPVPPRQAEPEAAAWEDPVPAPSPATVDGTPVSHTPPPPADEPSAAQPVPVPSVDVEPASPCGPVGTPVVANDPPTEVTPPATPVPPSASDDPQPTPRVADEPPAPAPPRR